LRYIHFPAGPDAIKVCQMILRRSVILALGSMPLLAGGVFSQTEVKPRRVGLLSSGAPITDTSELVVGLTAGFSKRGYVIGRSLVFERRAAEAHADRLPRLVDDLKSTAELIITQSYAAARVVKDRSNVPVVAITGADPVATGLVDSLARPGGNVTGVGEVAAELSAKRLEVLKDTFPSLRKIAMLWNADDLGMTSAAWRAGARGFRRRVCRDGARTSRCNPDGYRCPHFAEPQADLRVRRPTETASDLRI
jgi:putative ABC transport system substrate-binding protein